MVEEQVEPRAYNVRHWLPWVEVFQGFKVALDPKKLLLAAAGILAMAFWWWLCSVVFYSSRTKPNWGDARYSIQNVRAKDDTDESARKKAWQRFHEDRQEWNLIHEAAGDDVEWPDAGDLAEDPSQVDVIKNALDEVGHRDFVLEERKYNDSPRVPEDKRGKVVTELQRPTDDPLLYTVVSSRAYVVRPKPQGKMRTWPWFEDRGPNPYLLVTGKTGNPEAAGSAQYLPADRGGLLGWFVMDEVPVLIEPLVKFLRPVVYFLRPNLGFWNAVYLAVVLLGTLAIWGLFGGAITRMAAVQVARKEKIGIGEAVRFTMARWVSFFSAPLFPLLLVLVIVIFLIIFGLFHLIPWVGDIIVDGLGWPLVLLAGLVMAVVLVGLVGWPLMYATISAEGSDSFDALSRSYSYVYQSPWHYLWYSLVALCYGAVVVFFVGFMGSLTVYLGKWGVDQTPLTHWAGREPEFLFVYAPTSYHWRDLLMQPSDVVVNGVISQTNYEAYLATLNWNNKVGAVMVACWLYLVFLMIVGFGYSYFWTAGTIIYLLMRRKVDDTELDEVYLDEDEGEAAYPAPGGEEAAAPAGEPGAAPAAAGVGSPDKAPLQMVEPPSLKTPAPPEHESPPPVPGGAVGGGDGNPAPGGSAP